ncbi:MAG TPA: nucleoside 2-deoxyribosyltransferase [Candidatus Saccharimonadales bacterium]|nr:nucleoside 2-deoxyribosyltransferase [Candidatus Saccharimonadales bacterium]
MKKVFLSTSFSGQVDAATGRVLPEFRVGVEKVLGALRKEVEVFCAIEQEGWLLANDVPPEVGVQEDLAQIDASDVLLALVEEKPSAGVQFELGYAVAKGKRVILAARHGSELAYFNKGVVSAGLVTLVLYDDAASLVKHFIVALHAPEGPAA